jgi:hypothetical protein
LIVFHSADIFVEVHVYIKQCPNPIHFSERKPSRRTRIESAMPRYQLLQKEDFHEIEFAFELVMFQATDETQT